MVSEQAKAVIRLLQARVQRDEGGRGIGTLVSKAGADQLLNAAVDLIQAKSVVVMTGFPCMQLTEEMKKNGLSPQENDGPPGAACIARVASHLGKNVTVMIDAPSYKPVQSCLLSALKVEREVTCTTSCTVKEHQIKENVKLEVYPSAWSKEAESFLNRHLTGNDTNVVAIERAGKSRDGTYRTMKSRVLDPVLLAPLDTLFEAAFRQGVCSTTGIGDGGNEVGMGTLLDTVTETVNYGDEIACVTPSKNTLVTSCSNWGGWALANACSILAVELGIFKSIKESVDMLVGSNDDELHILRACVEAGARDGINLGKDSVDGIPYNDHMRVYQDLRAITTTKYNQNKV